jgi:nucleotide-binding universal stress UspA family protein
MIENIRSILVGLTKESAENEVSSAVGNGLSLAQAARAHLTVQAASLRVVLTGPSVGGIVAEIVDTENVRLRGLTEAVTRAAQGDAAAAGVLCSTQNPHLTYSELITSFTGLARVHDLTVIDAEPEAMLPDRGLIEAVLMQSGRPVIVVPEGRSTFSGRRIVVAWDGSARAARAVSDALPFLRAAEAVDVVTVTGEGELPDTVEGSDIGQHLARHEVSVTVRSVPAREGDVAQTLRDAAELSGADLIVMGGYVHSRLQEMLFGGVTQSLLRRSSVPLFLAY